MLYKIEANNAHDAATQFLDTFRKENPQLTALDFIFDDGSKLAVRVKNKPVRAKAVIKA